MKIKIQKIYVSDKAKDGTRFVSQKTGKPFKKIGILAEGNPVWISSLIFDENSPMLSWKTGDEVDIIVEQSGQYSNFRLPRKEDLFEARILALEQKVGALMRAKEIKEIKQETKQW